MKRLAVILAALAVLALPASAAAQGSRSKTIAQTAAGARQFSTLVGQLKRAGLVSALNGKTKLTVFAPTNAAFRKVPRATLAALGRDKAKLRAVLLYHVLHGSRPASKVVKLRSAKTLEGHRVRIRVRRSGVFVNQAKVIRTNIRASNGYIHAINSVLIPPAGPRFTG